MAEKNDFGRFFLANWAGHFGAPAAILVIGIALAANLPKAAATLGELAATLATYALLLPALARRLYDFVPREAGDPQVTVLTLFLVGAGLAVGQSLEPSRTTTSVTTALYLAAAVVACRLYVRAWLADASALPIWSLTRLSVGALALSALAHAAEGLGRITGLFKAPWVAAGLTDGPLLAVAFHATAVAAAHQTQEGGLLRLPARWPEMVTLAPFGAVATAIVQAWLTRYPGGRATALLVLTVAPLVAAAGLLLADALKLRAAGTPGWHGSAGGAILLLIVDFAFLAGAILASLQAVGAVLSGQETALWPWAWRLPLTLTAAAAWSAQWQKRVLLPTLPVGTFTAAGVVLALLGGYLWLSGSGLAWACFLSAGVMLATPAFTRTIRASNA